MRIFCLGILLWLVPATALASNVPTLSSQCLADELHALQPELKQNLRFDDNRYVVVEHDWLMKIFVPYFGTFLNHLHAGPAGGEGYDCNDFALLFRAKLSLSNLLAGGARQGEVPCGRLVVWQQVGFGGVTGRPHAVHALVLIRTDLGWYVVEPQTGASTSFQKYPNLSGVIDVIF